MPLRAQGAEANFQLEVRNGNGDFVDPTNLSLTFKDNLGAVISGFPEVYPGDIIKDAIGRYHLDWPIPVSFPLGTYTAQWDAILEGAPTQAFETWEIVAQGSLTTGNLDFLLKPDDYDAIRGLLGVTELDLEDAQIELAPFAPQAEMYIQRRVSNWATQITNDDQLFILRMAATYQTACYLAESYVRGGTIGLVRPLSTGEGRDWAEAAQQFCARADYWTNIADSYDDDPNDTSDYTIHPMRVGGPTRLRVERAQAGVGSPQVPLWAEGYPPFWPEQ